MTPTCSGFLLFLALLSLANVRTFTSLQSTPRCYSSMPPRRSSRSDDCTHCIASLSTCGLKRRLSQIDVACAISCSGFTNYSASKSSTPLLTSCTARTRQIRRDKRPGLGIEHVWLAVGSPLCELLSHYASCPSLITCILATPARLGRMAHE